MAYTLTKILIESSGGNLLKRVSLNKKLYSGFTLVQFYGKVQKAAIASRRLKKIDYPFYKILYKENIEMLYIYIDPIMSQIINRVQEAAPLSTEDLIEIFREFK